VVLVAKILKKEDHAVNSRVSTRFHRRFIHDMIYKCSKKQRLQTGEIKYSYTYLIALLYIHGHLISAIGSQKFVFFSPWSCRRAFDNIYHKIL